jgi:hypothetical protein
MHIKGLVKGNWDRTGLYVWHCGRVLMTIASKQLRRPDACRVDGVRVDSCRTHVFLWEQGQVSRKHGGRHIAGYVLAM